MPLTIPLSSDRSPGRILTGAIPPQLKFRWCLLTANVTGRAPSRAVWALDLDDGHVLTRFAAPSRIPGRGITLRCLLFIPAEATHVRLELFGAERETMAVVVTARPIPRAIAGGLVLGRNPLPVIRTALGGRMGWRRRLRSAMAVLASADPMPESYPLWALLFDHWSDADIGALLASPRRSEWPSIGAIVMAAGGAETEAARASLASLGRQALPIPLRVLAPGEPIADALHGGTERYVAILQAGEELPAHALALLAEWIARYGEAPALCADEDQLERDGTRARPLFKPEPNRALMLSGMLTRGLWLFRRDVLARWADAAPGWAETLRLDLWLRLHEVGEAGAVRRVPFVLAHRRYDAEFAPTGELAAVVAAHFARLGCAARVEAASFPLRVSPVLPSVAPQRVTLIVPSACRAPHVRTCLTAVLARTDHVPLELTVVLSQNGPLDAEQSETLRGLAEEPRVSVLRLEVESFNYSRANNEGARRSEADYLCLMNDDVAPLSPDWLSAMLGHFADPQVGAVGAKLCYENGTVQHGGVMLGMGGLADHINRFLPRGEPGYAHRAVLNQELSAVTAACLLVRRDVFEQVGGLDESFPIAFNDVDFCLKVRASGRSIVFCADAELTHYESLSLGHHFSGARSGIERIEVQRMRARWPEAVAADPFHNPNLSLTPGHEWNLAFPPRMRKADIIEIARASAS